MLNGAPGHHDLSRLDGVRVLVVDDSAAIREGVTEILEVCGATVTAVGSAEEALEVLQREGPDVLVSDLAMPGNGGYWLIGKVRALPPERGGQIPAAALTAYVGPEHRASILRAGFQYHVAKPVDPVRLAGVISILALKA
jgi:CheY-like chemotaxis protein